MMLFSQFHLSHIAHCRVVVVNQTGLFFSQYSSQLDNCGCSPKSCLFSGQYSPQFVWGNVVILVLFISQPFPFKSHGNSTLYAKVKNISLQKQNGGLLYSRAKTNLSNCSWIWKEVRICLSYHRTLFDVSYAETDPRACRSKVVLFEI